MKTVSFPFTIIPQNDHERFMLEALKEAWKAFNKEEVPVGAVLVRDGKIIARGHNQVELLKDATAHAEILCITAGAVACDNWRLSETTLYSTIEPCCMCAGAILLSRVEKVVWGAPDIRHGANGSWVDVFAKPHPTHAVTIEKGVMSDYCSLMMKEFFQKRREENKEKKHGEPIDQLGKN